MSGTAAAAALAAVHGAVAAAAAAAATAAAARSRQQRPSPRLSRCAPLSVWDSSSGVTAKPVPAASCSTLPWSVETATHVGGGASALGSR